MKPHNLPFQVLWGGTKYLIKHKSLKCKEKILKFHTRVVKTM